MTELINNRDGMKLNSDIFYVKNNQQFFSFFQADSGNLYISSKFPSVTIDKENDALYEATENLYEALTTGNFLKENYTEKEYFLRLLQDENTIVWESDFPVDSSCTKYNKLYIKKEKESYIFEFINYSNQDETTICFSINRSKYRLFVVPFLIYLKDLNDISEEKKKEYRRKG